MGKGLVSYPLSMSPCHLTPEEKAPGGRAVLGFPLLSASVAFKGCEKGNQKCSFQHGA